MSCFSEFTRDQSANESKALKGREAMRRWLIFKEYYLERQEVRHQGSDHPANCRTVLDRFTRYCDLYERMLVDISSIDIDTYVAKRLKDRWRDRPLSPRTINNEIDIINTAFSWAGPKEARGHARSHLGLLTFPPYGELLACDDSMPVSLTPEQLRGFMLSTKQARTPRYLNMDPQAFWLTAGMLALITSLRRRALLLVPRPDDYTLLERRQIVLPAKLSKTRTEQRISLGGADAVAIVASLPSVAGEPLLPWRDKDGRRMGLDHFSHALRDLQRRAGIRDEDRVKLKHMRSTAASEIGDHFSSAVAKKRLGHSPSTNTFERNYQSRKVSAVDVEASNHLSELFLGPARQLQLFPPSLLEEKAKQDREKTA